MLHRALFGSIERFFGVLLEHYAGAFPTWLAPVQVRVLPVATAHEEYARKVTERLVAAGARADLIGAGDALGKRIRSSKLEKIPYILVVGEKEASSGSVNVRSRDQGELGEMSFDQFVSSLEVRDIAGKIEALRDSSEPETHTVEA